MQNYKFDLLTNENLSGNKETSSNYIKGNDHSMLKLGILNMKLAKERVFST